MKNWFHLLLAAGVAALVGVLSTLIAPAGRGADARGSAAEADELHALQGTLTELRAEQQTLAQRLESLPTAPAAAPGSARTPARDLDAAIADYMARQLTAEPSGGDVVAAEPADAESAAIAERILSGQVQGEELQ